MKQIMVATATVALGVLLAGAGYAQEIPPNGPFGGARGAGDAGRREMRGRLAAERGGINRGGAGMQSEMLFRMLQDPQVVKEIGLSAEKTAALKEAFRKVQEKQIDLQAELDKLNLQQTGQVAELLADRGKKADGAIELVEKMGKINTDLSKLTIERILAIRENLTDDQIKKAREVGEARMERMREAFRNRQAGEGGGGREGREGGRGDRERDRPREGRDRPDRPDRE
jgi:hypothetical protein